MPAELLQSECDFPNDRHPKKTRDRARGEVAGSVRNVWLPFDARDRIAIVDGQLRNVSDTDGPPPCQNRGNYAPRWLWQGNFFLAASIAGDTIVIFSPRVRCGFRLGPVASRFPSM